MVIRPKMGLYRISSEMWAGSCKCKFRYVGCNVGSRRWNGDLGMSLNGPFSEFDCKWEYIA